MPKKSKEKSSKTTKGKDDGGPKVPYAELIAHDPDFFIGTSKFEFPNGDKYEGEYCAHAKGLVWRQGRGTYITKDGQTYNGVWDGDKLVETEDVEIVFPDGTMYLGALLKSKYSGCGIYQLEEKVSLTCNFVDNKPTGEITLIDPNGKAWHGFAEKDESLLIQEHPFYRSIGKDLGKGRSKQKPVQQKDSKTSMTGSKKSDTGSQTGLKYSDLRDLEKEIFGKSKKTPSDLQLDSSEWYQSYVNYCNTYGDIVQKAKTNGENSLTTEEYDWYKKYKEFENRYASILKDYKSKTKKGKIQGDTNWFQYIHSAEYKNANKPNLVLYPRKDTEEEDCDSTCEC